MYGSANLNLGGHFRRNARIEPHADRKIARVADVGHINAALFHLHAILLKQLVGNLLRGDGAVKPAALRAARHDLDGLAGKRLADFLRLGALNILGLASPLSAVLSAIIYNALVIVALIPAALKGVKYREVPSGQLLTHNLLVWGLGGIVAPFVFIKIIDMLLALFGIGMM